MAEAVHANLDDLRSLRKAVDKAEQELNEALRNLQRALDRTDWKDAKRRDFEDKLKAASTSVQQATRRVGELKPILQREIEALRTYLGR